MGISYLKQTYPDVIVSISKDNESGLIISKTFFIKNNELQVRDNLMVMCLKHDLHCIDCEKAFDEPSVMCCLRSFDCINSFITHIKNKASNGKYSFKIRGTFALAKIGEKSYVYRVLTKNI